MGINFSAVTKSKADTWGELGKASFITSARDIHASSILERCNRLRYLRKLHEVLSLNRIFSEDVNYSESVVDR